MRLQISFVDHSGIKDRWPFCVKATRDVERQVDEFADLRMIYGLALKPAEVHVLAMGGGLLAVIRRAQEGE